jgi:hypothetical protein
MSEERARWRVSESFNDHRRVDIYEGEGESSRHVGAMRPADAAQVIADRERVQAVREALEDMVDQFAYRWEHDGKTTFTTGGLSALENALMVLGLDDPHTIDEAALARPAATGDD